jgi:hypothetical protein
MEWETTSGNSTIITELPNKKGIVCAFTTEFRQLAKQVPENCLVLEIGASYGRCTAIIADALTHPSQVVGIDISKEVIASATAEYPHLNFVRADCLRDPVSTLRIWQTLRDRHIDKNLPLVVFVDIGGNRELESLVALLPWLETKLPTTSIVVKSETLHAAVSELGEFDWKLLHTRANDALQKRKMKVITETKEEATKEIKTKEIKTKEITTKETKTKETTKTTQNTSNPRARAKVVERPKKKMLHPLKAPLRTNSQGVAICRFHNYDIHGCCKFLDVEKIGTTCPYDHIHCHICLSIEHIALNCQTRPLI